MEHISLKKEVIFKLAALSFVAGVGVRSFVSIPATAAWLLVFMGVALAAAAVMSRRSSALFICAAVSLCLGLGVLRYSASEPEVLSLAPYIGKNVVYTAVVSREPDERDTGTLLTVSVIEVSGEKVDGNMLVSLERYPKYEYGDLLSLQGVAKAPEKFVTDAGVAFDYPAYLAKEHIYQTLYRPQVSKIKEGEGNVIVASLLSLKSAFLTSANRYIPEPESSLLGGLLLGAKQGLPQDVEDALRRAGIIHIVVLSGYNITIVAEAVMRSITFLGFYSRLSVGAVTIALFAVMTGGSSTVVRASIMALLVLVARATGRTYAITQALIVAGVVMVVWNPKILIFDPSFELSFLATLGLIYVAPRIEQWFQFAPTRFQIRETIVATLSTQALVTPLILYMTGQFSVVALLSNLLVLPLIPLTMLLGFLAGVFGFVHHVLSIPFAYGAYFLLHSELTAASFLGSLSWASISFPHVSGLVTVLLYASVLFIVLRLRNVSPSRSS